MQALSSHREIYIPLLEAIGLVKEGKQTQRLNMTPEQKNSWEAACRHHGGIGEINKMAKTAHKVVIRPKGNTLIIERIKVETKSERVAA